MMYFGLYLFAILFNLFIHLFVFANLFLYNGYWIRIVIRILDVDGLML